MRPITQEKIDQLSDFMAQHKIDAILIADWENARDVNMRYLTGHPMDATMVITNSGETGLVPWDLQLAQEHAVVDELMDVSNFDNRWSAGAIHFIKEKIKKDAPVIGVNHNIPYQYIMYLEKTLPEAKIFDGPYLISNKFRELRSTKAPHELEKIIEAGKIGTKVINDIKKFAQEKDGTENDLSFLVMKKLREYGAEDNSFPSIVANTQRSYMIHCHPWAGNNVFSENGLSLIDFGALYDGYVSDITLPITFGKLKPEQEKIRDTTIKAYEVAINTLEVGQPLWKVAQAVDDVMTEAGYAMPHSLGHGLGLAVHDSPAVSLKPKDELTLQTWEEVVAEEGMVFTIEPGAYVKGLGGLRLENDVMIRNGKVEVYTKSELIEVD
ncbi:MAG: aminopeptidase P family protein [Asgard group archaeon]|nr:aminopeptidase P family protein [Asgard group archaeon]